MIHDSLVMPVLFVGHGTPMNAIEDNEFSKEWKRLGGRLPRPEAILCVSAHWVTDISSVTSERRPGTIHDFGGFPRELYAQQYPAPGAPELASLISDRLGGIGTAYDRGFDHGTWSVLKHMYPKADIPVVQLSIDYSKTMREHYDLGRELRFLRRMGVLIIGSGNMVHNLGMVRYDTNGELNTEDAYDWAAEMNDALKDRILSGDHRAVIDYRSLSGNFRLGVPTEEHYIPLIYSLGLREDGDRVESFNDKIVGGSISMTSFVIGNL